LKSEPCRGEIRPAVAPFVQAFHFHATHVIGAALT
jgi:hypothetical protein